MKIHLLSGFLGSGKTTAIQEAVRLLLRQGIRAGVITNDQGIKLVDGDLFKHLNIPGRQVVNGCFCCNFNDLDASIKSLVETNNTEIIFAESVGSCTDIVATVLKPLLQSSANTIVTVSTFADVRLLKMILSNTSNSFDEEVNYIYRKQLEEAGIIIINKIDVISNEALAVVQMLMQEKYGDKILLYQNSLDEDSIRQWLHTLDSYSTAGNLGSLTIDYEIYATGEAKLAWFDAEVEIYSSTNDSLKEAEYLINTIYKKINEQRYSIGHLKFLVNQSSKISFTSNDQQCVELKKEASNKASILINIRLQTEPELITQLIKEAIAETESKYDCKIIVASLSAFQPGYPKPTHRII